ncbi:MULTISPECIES: dynamin family protein [unclassified Diaminobutyricimonas]|uniref:dynamin family protein n=1 Tax=unclassified Diaminobutyricimonas TaxID=2643261 RepID=UPI0012F52A33|nr:MULTISPECIES: dynamin family protein [unclassified Diaminobutyricimonas]
MSDLVRLVERGIELAKTGERPDLGRRLEQTRRRLLDPSTRVMVVGEFKQGKSQLINALVGAPVCPVDDDVATSVPTVVRYGDKPSAVLIAPQAGAADGEQTLVRRNVSIDALAAHVAESGNPGNQQRLVAAEVFIPRKVLGGGLSLVDSPGMGGVDSTHSLATLTALPTAEAMLLVSDASQEYTGPEIQFLRHALRVSPNVACVLTKTDLYPDWRRVAELDRGHLDKVDPNIPLFAISSEMRLLAGRLEDAELNTESGFPALVAYLRQHVLAQSALLQRRSVAHDLTSVTDHLRLSLQTELSALTDPENTPQMLAELQAARERADDLRRRSARWQVTLNDGVSDLIADMEYDLRDRMRSIQRDADAAIDAADPGPIWDELVAWLEERVASAVSDTFVWTNERSQWLSQQVSEHFTGEERPLPMFRVDSTDEVLEPVEPVSELDSGRLGPMQKVFIGMRGSYGGVLMFGLLTGIIGMSLINPISIGAGVLLGGKAYRDERETRLKRRQSEAKNLIRSHIDDVIFQVGKQLKDRLRLVQRATRDHFTEIAEEHVRSLNDSVLAAQKAATSFTLEREHRMKAIREELARVSDLRKRAEQVDTAATEKTTPQKAAS